jgi:hypothetical protein
MYSRYRTNVTASDITLNTVPLNGVARIISLVLQHHLT